MRQTAGASSNDLYRAVLNEIDELLRQLDGDTMDLRVAQTMEQVGNLVSPIHANLVERIEALERCARWDTFTIAFYGETNAGKSTIIETLRILLAEQTKAEARSTFRVKQEQAGLSEDALLALRQSIDDSRIQLEVLRTQIAGRIAELQADHDALEQELSRLRHLIDAKRAVASFWEKLLYLFRRRPEEVALARAEQRRLELGAAHTAEREQLQVRLGRAEEGHQALDDREASARAALDTLAPWADGHIVGTGRSDYTLDAHSYAFDVHGQRFELLDVPGIEGKEARVIDSILGAVKAAHAVFHVTSKAAAPQTGDENGQGTLEKIRAHLGDQTEVWSIYNKRITNPIQLDKEELLSSGERDSLAVLDATMREHLGERYRCHWALSALPAFFAAADCLVPFSDLARSRAKFLAKADADALLSKSGFQAFLDWLTGNMVIDCDARIRAANVNKVRSAVLAATGTITLVQRDTVAPLAAQMKRDWAHVDQQLELAVSGLAPGLQTLADDAIRSFEAGVRRRVYRRIDDGIGNDDLKHELGVAIRNGQATLEAELPQQMTTQIERFQQDVADLLERFRKRVEQIQDAYRSVGALAFGGALELNMTFDSGVKYMPLVAALAGGLMMWWNPAGWVTLAIGGVTLVVSIAKALWGLIDSDYKKSQQRKATDNNIEHVVDRMRSAMKRSCDDVIENVTARIGEIAAEVEQSVEQAAHVNSALIRVCANLTQLSKTMSEKEMV